MIGSHEWFDDVKYQAANDPLAGPVLLKADEVFKDGAPFAREILRLAEEVEAWKLSDRLHAARVVALEAEKEHLFWLPVPREERARIRRELVAALREIAGREVSGGDTYYVGVRDGRNALLRSIVEALNHIVPGEAEPCALL